MEARKPWVLGLTGGIASGKSTVASLFSDLGVYVVDVDQVARDVVAPGSGALQSIVDRFGRRVLRDDGALDRSAVRAVIFEDSRQRLWLEGLLHPLIARVTDERLASASTAYAIMVSPLLIESGRYRRADRVLVVDVPEDVQLSRAIARDTMSETQARAMLGSQMARSERLQHAHDVLVNERDLAWLKCEVDRLHGYYLSLRGGDAG